MYKHCIQYAALLCFSINTGTWHTTAGGGFPQNTVKRDIITRCTYIYIYNIIKFIKPLRANSLQYSGHTRLAIFRPPVAVACALLRQQLCTVYLILKISEFAPDIAGRPNIAVIQEHILNVVTVLRSRWFWTPIVLGECGSSGTFVKRSYPPKYKT